MSERRTLLIEIGCEEIPARMLEGAATDLAAVVTGLLDRAEVAHGEARALWTPRRLTVIVADTATHTASKEQTLLGPPAAAAWGADGAPAPALLGFAKKQGLDPAAFTRIETERGIYAGARVSAGGKSLGEVLAAGFAQGVARMQFPKSMRWGQGEHRFVRPVHWLVALAGDEVLPLELFGVAAGRTTRGHRALAPGEHVIETADDYVQVLAAAHVTVDPARRHALLEDQLAACAQAEGGRAVPDAELLAESNGLVEHPGVLTGAFDERFAQLLPREVLQTCLRHHQKAFTIVGERGLLPAFAVAVNVAADPQGHVRRGHEWVVGGRLEDALFFWQEDRKRTLAERAPALDGVVFHKDLGTYAQKSRRVARLARALGERLGLDAAATGTLERAALLARCDLISGLVGEFPELQGVAGGLLASADGEPETVARAIYDLYRPASADDELPSTREGRLLGLADRLDTLAGGFAVGLVPSGSKDPFALRRAGTGAVLLALAESGLDLREACDLALAGFVGGESGPDLRARADETRAPLVAFLLERFAGWAERDGARYDEIAAVRAVAGEGPLVLDDLARRLAALRGVRGSADFLALAAASKRVRNILAQANERGERVAPGADGDALALPAERALADTLALAEDAAGSGGRDYEATLRRLAGLRPDVDRFFDEILVMDEDARVRRARLGLLARIHALASATVEMAELVVEGHERS